MEIYTITSVLENGSAVHTVAAAKFDMAVELLNAKLRQDCARDKGNEALWVHMDLPEWDPKVMRSTPLGNITFHHARHTV